MSNEMQQEMNAVKERLGGVEIKLGAVETKLDAVETKLGAVETKLGAVETKLDAVETKFTGLDSRLTTVENTTRGIAIVVAGHTEAFVRIEKRLEKLNELDGLKNSLEVFTSEIIASRHARILTDKSFSDQQATLTDHELRLTRIELRGKQS
jgi:chromosome segregation ATPase